MPTRTPALQDDGSLERDAIDRDDRADSVAQPQLRAVLFDADRDDRALDAHWLDAGAVDCKALTDRQLLWIDVEGSGEQVADALLQQLVRQLELGDGAIAALRGLNGHPRLQNFGDWFLAQAIVVEHEGQLKFNGRGLAIAAGRNFVLSLHHGPLALLEELRSRERADTHMGVLSAESFAASLLDWQLESYFDAVTDFEAAVDRLEVAVLATKVHRESLPQLAELRRSASRLRRMLAPHRNLFSALARPDFRPDADGDANAHFLALDERFARAMDAVENARDLVVGSFELFATRTAQRTNETMRALTVFTVLLGTLAVLAGVLGMNFPAQFFESGARGFWIAVGSMLALTGLALALARWRRWL
jgi:Mg2+ and Co2+ transporter CorA